MLQHFGEPPAWDAFSKVDVRKLDPSEWEDDHEAKARAKEKENAIVKAKPMSINGWDPETRTQQILTEQQMENGSGMGAMELEHWRVTALEERDVGQSWDCSFGGRTIMKLLLEAGKGSENPLPPSQVELTYCGRALDGEGGATVFDDDHAATPAIFELAAGRDTRFKLLDPWLVRAVKTMKEGERVKLTVEPKQAFGEEGNEALGVPPDATLEYDLHMRRIVHVSEYDHGGIVMRRLERDQSTEGKHGRGVMTPTPQPNAEVAVLWSGALIEDALPGEAFVNTEDLFRP